MSNNGNRQQKIAGLLVIAGAIAFILIQLHNYSLYHGSYEPITPSVIEGIQEIQAYYNPIIVLFTVVGVLGTGLYLMQIKQGKCDITVPIAFLCPFLSLLIIWIGSLLPLLPLSPLFMGLFTGLMLVAIIAPVFGGILLFLAINRRNRLEAWYLSVALGHNVLYLYTLIRYMVKSMDVFS